MSKNLNSNTIPIKEDDIHYIQKIQEKLKDLGIQLAEYERAKINTLEEYENLKNNLNNFVNSLNIKYELDQNKQYNIDLENRTITEK